MILLRVWSSHRVIGKTLICDCCSTFSRRGFVSEVQTSDKGKIIRVVTEMTVFALTLFLLKWTQRGSVSDYVGRSVGHFRPWNIITATGWIAVKLHEDVCSARRNDSNDLGDLIFLLATTVRFTSVGFEFEKSRLGGMEFLWWIFFFFLAFSLYLNRKAQSLTGKSGEREREKGMTCREKSHRLSLQDGFSTDINLPFWLNCSNFLWLCIRRHDIIRLLNI